MKSMKQEKQQEIALMRYGAIAPIIAGWSYVKKKYKLNVTNFLCS
jgi:hypothetical protein